MKNKPKFEITTQADNLTVKVLLTIIVVSALVIAFLSTFLSIPVTIGLFALHIIEEPETKAGQMKALGYAYLGIWAVLYIAFILKFFWNWWCARHGIENCNSEGKYSFYDDHLKTTLEEETRRIRYSEMLHVENRNNEAFAFIAENPTMTGTVEIVFGLNKTEIKLKQGKGYGAKIRRLISAANPSCEFHDVVKGTKTIAKDKKKKSTTGT